MIPNNELSKYGIIDDYENENDNESENESDEISTDESSTTNSTDILMAEIISHKPKNMISKIPKPNKPHLAPENLYYRSMNKPKTTKKNYNNDYKFKSNKIPYSSLDHRFESVIQTQEILRKERIQIRKKEIEDSVQPFHGLEEREIINQFNKSISLENREKEIRIQHKQFHAKRIEDLCQKHTNDEIIKEKEEIKHSNKIRNNEKSQRLLKQSHLPLRMDMDKISKEHRILEEKKLNEEKNIKQKKSLEDYLKPHFTKPKPFSFDNPDSGRYQQLQLLKKRISEREYQDRINDNKREKEEEENYEQYIKLLLNKQYPFPRSTIAIKYLSDKRRKEIEDERKKKMEEEEQEKLRKKKEKDLSKSKKEYLKKLNEDMSEDLITERAEIRQKEIKTRIKAKPPSLIETDNIEDLPIKYVEPELRYKREMLRKKKEEESIQEEVEKYIQQMKKKRKKYKRNSGIYSYPPNYHDINNNNNNNTSNIELNESLEKTKEKPKIENEIENNNNDVFEDEFEENLDIKKEETNQTISIQTPKIEDDTIKQESINKSESNPKSENNFDEDEFFD